jgi:hypothetical protein
MASNTFDVLQDIFTQSYPSIHVVSLDENALVANPKILGNFLSTSDDGVIGLAPVYGAKCRLTTLAFSTLSDVLLIRFSSGNPNGKKKRKTNTTTPHLTPGRKLLQDNILCHPERQKFAFRMDRLAASIFLDQGLRIWGGVDLLSSSKAARRSLDALMNALGGETTLYKDNMKALFKHEETATTPIRDVALQAWAACRAGSHKSLSKLLSKIPTIDTQDFGREVCDPFDPSFSPS